MHSNVNIQNELKELNSILATVSNMNVYTVPDGYFDAISHDILMAVQQDTPQVMDKNSVPAGYFDGLADSIMGKIKTRAAEENEDSALLAGLKGINVYQVPAGYFDNLATAIIARINVGVDEEESSTLLDSIKGINVYQVPAGYFDNLSEAIVSKIEKPAKVIEMKPRSSFFRYAAAAAITGIIGLSVISVFNKRDTTIDPSLPAIDVMAKASDILKNNSFDKELSTVSDADLVNYLKESGEDVNAALVASVEEENNLPEQIDYMTDDKTLDNLLNELNIAQPATN